MLQHRLSLPEMHLCHASLSLAITASHRAENMIKWHCILFMTSSIFAFFVCCVYVCRSVNCLYLDTQ